jgi:hypothetical protein
MWTDGLGLTGPEPFLVTTFNVAVLSLLVLLTLSKLFNCIHTESSSFPDLF